MNNQFRTIFTIIALQTAASQSLFAAEITVPPVAASNVWVRATVPAQQVTGAFMTLTSVSDLKLVSASSPQAGTVEIHQMSMENNVMPKRVPVELKPGGYHLMLMGLKTQMKAGARVPLTLIFESSNKKKITLKLDADIKDMTAKGNGESGMAH